MEDEKLLPHQQLAEMLHELGWRNHCDAQSTNLRDAMGKLRELLTEPVPDVGQYHPLLDMQAVHALAAAAVADLPPGPASERAYIKARAQAIRGASMRDYFMAHAPQQPQSWFKPDMPPKPQPPEIQGAHKEHHKAAAQWEKEADKQRELQWPAAWADEMLKRR